MAALLDQLVDDGFEAFWSGASRNDRRNIGDFNFTYSKNSQRPIDRRAASDFVRSLCAQAGHAVTGLYDNFGRQGNRGSIMFVKFVHVASVSLFEAYAKEKGPWTLRGDTIEYSVPDNFVSLTPTMIATCDASGEDTCELEAELLGLVDEYNSLWRSDERILDTSTMWQDSIFLATCSSLALADFITTKEVQGYKSPYEYVYDLNEYLFVPARRRLRYARQEAEYRRSRGLEPEAPGSRPVTRSAPPLQPPRTRAAIMPIEPEVADIPNISEIFESISTQRERFRSEQEYSDAFRELLQSHSAIEDAAWEVEEHERDLKGAQLELQALKLQSSCEPSVERSPADVGQWQAKKDMVLMEIRLLERRLGRRELRLAQRTAEGRALVAERAVVERVKGEQFRDLFPLLVADDDPVPKARTEPKKGSSASSAVSCAKSEPDDPEIRAVSHLLRQRHRSLMTL